jgi:hypothetical protein
MSLKFEKGRSVDYRYHAIPLQYTGIKHPNDAKKELVLIDDYKTQWLAAYRSDKTNRVGRTFMLKKGTKNGKRGFYHRGKFIDLSKSGWVW